MNDEQRKAMWAKKNGGSGQIFRNRSEMESGEGVKCKKCRGYGY